MGWLDAKRHLEYQGEEAAEGRDLDGTAPFAVQAKCWRRTPSISSLEEIVPTEEYSIPLALLKRTRGGGRGGLEVIVLPAKEGLRMIELIKEHGLLELVCQTKGTP